LFILLPSSSLHTHHQQVVEHMAMELKLKVLVEPHVFEDHVAPRPSLAQHVYTYTPEGGER
jgi:hypothetical protein